MQSLQIHIPYTTLHSSEFAAYFDQLLIFGP
jgi:hypothetical protein